MDHRTALAAIAFAIAAGLAGPANAGPITRETGPNLVTNGGFETGDFTGWTVAVDPTFSGVDDVSAHTGRYGAYFGDFGRPGSIGQTLATLAGASYDIHLWLRSDGLVPNSFEVLWGGTSVYRSTDVGAFGYTELVVDPVASGTATTLTILARDDAGFLEVDDVSVRRVPEPAGVALFAPALLAMVALRRRKT